MGYWNYRVVRRCNPPDASDEHCFGIHEIYYAEDGSVEAWTESPCSPVGATPAELVADLRQMTDALSEPWFAEQDGQLVQLADGPQPGDVTRSTPCSGGATGGTRRVDTSAQAE